MTFFFKLGPLVLRDALEIEMTYRSSHCMYCEELQKIAAILFNTIHHLLDPKLLFNRY